MSPIQLSWTAKKKARKAENYKCPFMKLILWGNMCPLACHTGDDDDDDVFAYIDDNDDRY